ncbi:transmembrane protein 70 homolog, mitochondrial [Drosophila navojoa]|nr:transmembrane protein 70 homolog, mitochondrial [Drosophila navojoa]
MLTIRCGKRFAPTMTHISRAVQVQSNCGFAASARTQLQHQQQLLQQQRKQLQQQQLRGLATPVADKDTDDKDLKRIYYGTLAPRMRLVKLFSLSTSLAGLAAQPILMEQGMKIGGTGMAVFLCSVGGFFTFVTPILLHLVTKKYVTELHYNQATDEYIATTISLILIKIKTKFRPSDVTVPEVPGMFTSFLVKKRPLFVDPALFDDPEHYVRIMGYDKPIDFKLNLKHDSERVQKKE